MKRYAWPGPGLTGIPNDHLEMVVVVPVYNEPDIIRSLEALQSCEQPPCAVEVLSVVNFPEDTSREIIHNSKKTYAEIEKWSLENSRPGFKFFPVWTGGLKKKFAGPGLARKIGMDEAVRRLFRAGNDNGLIVSFDADCTCDADYLLKIYQLYKNKIAFNGCAVFYEHFVDLQDDHLADHIVNYELHLRYYSNALKYAGYPYFFHTIGSTMVVTASAYVSAGGMNRRKAGEDFFFLQKIFPMGGFYYLNTTTVYPSARVSDRVPFGTGATMAKLEHSEDARYPTYNPKSFHELKDFLNLTARWYNADDTMIVSALEDLSPAIRAWLYENDFTAHLSRIKNDTASDKSFLRVFYQWFNRFKVLKYVHFTRDHFYHNVDVVEAVNTLMPHIDLHWSITRDRTRLLKAMRRYDRRG